VKICIREEGTSQEKNFWLSFVKVKPYNKPQFLSFISHEFISHKFKKGNRKVFRKRLCQDTKV
jgi:hypothetical protein